MAEKNERRRPPGWHRGVFALAAAPLLLFALMGWEYGAFAAFGIPSLICVCMAIWPTRLGAAILFCPFSVGACFYGWLLVKDLFTLGIGGTPAVLLDADDALVFIVLELTLLTVSGLLLVIWRPLLAKRACG